MVSEKKQVQSVARAAAILGCFKQQMELGITEISKMVGLHKSTVFGLVDTLVNCELLSQDPVTGKYRLGMEVVRLGALTNITFREIGRPFLIKLAAEFGETVNLVVHDDFHTIYVEKIESTYSTQICTTVGQLLPFYCTGVGCAILSFQPEEKVATALQHYSFRPYTRHTLKSEDALREKMELTRKLGYAVDDEEYEEGIVCVGVAILTPEGIPFAGISVSGPKYRMTSDIISRIGNSLVEYAPQITKNVYG